MEPLASLPGQFLVFGQPVGDWIGGWREGGAVAVRPATREAVRLAPPIERGDRLVVGDRVLASLTWAEGQSTVRIYSYDTR